MTDLNVSCRALKDPLTLAALELLGHSPRSGSAQVMEALLLRLRLEEVHIFLTMQCLDDMDDV